MRFVIKAVVAGIWLAAAYGLMRGSPTGRRIFSYVGVVVVMVHLGALIGGMLQHSLSPARSVEDGVDLMGFIVGGLLGVVLGGLLGTVAVRNGLVYWVAQVAAAAFLAFLPLFRW